MSPQNFENLSEPWKISMRIKERKRKVWWIRHFKTVLRCSRFSNIFFKNWIRESGRSSIVYSCDRPRVTLYLHYHREPPSEERQRQMWLPWWAAGNWSDGPPQAGGSQSARTIGCGFPNRLGCHFFFYLLLRSRETVGSRRTRLSHNTRIELKLTWWLLAQVGSATTPLNCLYLTEIRIFRLTVVFSRLIVPYVFYYHFIY